MKTNYKSGHSTAWDAPRLHQDLGPHDHRWPASSPSSSLEPVQLRTGVRTASEDPERPKARPTRRPTRLGPRHSAWIGLRRLGQPRRARSLSGLLSSPGPKRPLRSRRRAGRRHGARRRQCQRVAGARRRGGTAVVCSPERVHAGATPRGAQLAPRQFPVLTQFPLDKTHQAKEMPIEARSGFEMSGGGLSPRQQPLSSSAHNASDRPASGRIKHTRPRSSTRGIWWPWAERTSREARGRMNALAPDVLVAHVVKLVADMDCGAVSISEWLVQEGEEEPRPYVTHIVRMAEQLRAAPAGTQFSPRQFPVLTQFPLGKTHQAKGNAD